MVVRILLCLALLGAIALPTLAEEREGAPSFSLRFENVPVTRILRVMSDHYGANLAVTGDIDTTVTVNLQGMPLPRALDALLHGTGYVWVEEDAVYRVLPATTVETRLIPLRFSSAAELAEVLRAQMEDLTVTAEPHSNSVIVTGPLPLVWETEKLLAEIDRQRRQVRIRAEMVEVTLTGSTVRGVDLTAILDGSDVDATARTSFGDAADPSTVRVGLIDGDFDVTGVLAALNEDRDASLLSSPTITTLDNQPARIHVGERVPYQRSTTETTTGATLAEVEFIDVGVRLEVTPTISDDQHLYLKIHSEVSEVLDQSVLNIPRIGTREADTRVMVRAGETVVIAGLLRDNYVKTTKKVPLLGDIPLLGLLFRREQTDKIKTELLIFIRPEVVDDPLALRPSDEEAALRGRFDEPR